MGRKSKEQVQAERAERERLRMQTHKKEQAERAKLREKQKRERDNLRKAQAARRRKASTKAGGKREGAGRPPKDEQDRQTYTFYASYHERQQVRRFLRALRIVEQDRKTASLLFQRLSGQTVFELLTSDSVGLPNEKRLIESLMPDLLPSGEID